MAWGEDAADQREQDQPREISLPAPTDEAADQYDRLLNGVSEAKQAVAEAEQEWWAFIEEHAERTAPKPYKVCGLEDAYHPRHEEGHPEYDEDDLVPGVICQLPRNHRDLGYRNHLEMRDGKVWGAWG